MFRNLKPDINCADIYTLDTESLRRGGVRGLFFDIDNTMEPYSTPKPGARLSEWLEGLTAEGFVIGILSNARQERIAKFVGGFPPELRDRILYVYKAAKPLKKGFRKLLADAGLRAEEGAMIGDQLFTDIWGGNRAGLTTVLVTPIDPSIEPPFVRFKRIFEKPFIRNERKQS